MEVKLIFSYLVNLRSAWATQDPVSYKQTNKKKAKSLELFRMALQSDLSGLIPLFIPWPARPGLLTVLHKPNRRNFDLHRASRRQCDKQNYKVACEGLMFKK